MPAITLLSLPITELTSYTYDSSNRLTSTTLPSGLVTTNIYGADGFLAQQNAIGYATNSYTYSNALLYTHTDQRGLTTTNTWDNLNRLTSTLYPDGSYASNQYTALDLTSTKDRLGNWTFYGYDSMRRKIAETNALGNVTIYNYCTCGSLESIQDAANNLTSFYYDNQGNLTNTVYADSYSVIRVYDLLRRVIKTTDSGGNNVTNGYNNQGLIVSVKNYAGQLSASKYDVLDRVTNSVGANGVSINTTYDNLNRPLARSYPDGGVENWGYTLNVSGATSYANQIGNAALYGYDAMNRKTNEVSVGVMTNQFAYNGAGDLLALTDGRNQTTAWHYDTFGRVTNKVDAAGVVDFVYQYDADNHLTNRWTPAKGNTGYTYDNVGNLKSINYQLSTINYSYDALNRRTNMLDSLGSTVFSYDAAGELLSAGGLWSNDTVSYAYTNRLRASLSVGVWSQTYGYDAARRLKCLTSPAGTFGYVYGAPSIASALVDEITLPNSAFITNTFDSVARLTGTYLKNNGNNVLDGYTYVYNQFGQRTNIVRNYGLISSSANAGYDPIGELTSWQARDANGSSRLNEQLGYTYDAAGNLKQRTNNNLLQTFSVDAVNELTNISRAGTLTVSGNTPTPASSVAVNGQPALTYADFTFASSNGFTLNDGQNSFTNIAWNYYGTVTVTNTITANLPANVALQFDANGNLTNDGMRSLGYDTENQLTNVTVAGQWREDFLYDGMNRRRITRQYVWQGGVWSLTNETRFIYDGNAVIQEQDSNNVAQVTYTRGLDLFGSLQGAGGIGGLLARTDTNSSTFYHADGNGNITSLMDTNQYMAARYLYEPFGRLVGKWGPLADVNVYRFSSKEWDANSGLYYYLYRFYDPTLQRWPNRDPLGELGFTLLAERRQAFIKKNNTEKFRKQLNMLLTEPGGPNRYGFVGNSSPNQIDPLGLDAAPPLPTGHDQWYVCCSAIKDYEWGDYLGIRHCDLRYYPCDSGDESHKVSRDCNCNKNGINNESAYQACLWKHMPIPAGNTPGDNCQSHSMNAMNDCCAKSDWKPDWIAYPPPLFPPF